MFNFISFGWVLFGILTASVLVLSIAVWVQSSKAKKSQRAMFHKRAVQNAKLLSLLFFFLLLFSACDISLKGPVFTALSEELKLYWLFLPLFSFLGFLFSRIWYNKLRQKNKPGFPLLWAVLTVWASLKAFGCMVIPSILVLQKTPLLPFEEIFKPTLTSQNLDIFIGFINKVLQILLTFLTALPLSTMILWTLTVLLLGMAFGYAFAALYCLSRRNADDYGRDYYQMALKDYGKLAFMYSLLLIGVFFILIALNPSAFLNLGASLGTTFSFPPETTWLNLAAWCSACLIFVAPIIYAFIGKNQTPLRFKALISLAPCFLFVGVWALMPLFAV